MKNMSGTVTEKKNWAKSISVMCTHEAYNGGTKYQMVWNEEPISYRRQIHVYIAKKIRHSEF